MDILIISCDLPEDTADLIREDLIFAGYRDVHIFNDPFAAIQYMKQKGDVGLIIYDYDISRELWEAGNALTALAAEFSSVNIIIITWEPDLVDPRFDYLIVDKKNPAFPDVVLNYTGQLLRSR